MPKTLYARFALVLVGLLLALGLFGLLGAWWTTSLYREEVEQRLNLDLAEECPSGGTLTHLRPTPRQDIRLGVGEFGKEVGIP